MHRHLVLRLEAPLMAFGGVMIDRLGPVRDTPSASTVTGLLANALGVYRWEAARLDRLQERLVFGCRVDRRGRRFTEFQTAQLGADDRGWTTRGRPEGRAGGVNTYASPHIRERDHDADARVIVAVRLLAAAEPPTLDDLARALDEPARPLFLGRKPCLPAAPLFAGFVEAATVYDALLAAPIADSVPARRAPSRPPVDPSLLLVVPAEEPCPPGFRATQACERRDWAAGVHAGDVTTFHGHVPRERLTPQEAA
ncbi:type I-E CRISPR-associated protein Cas5/CasD [Gemmatimonadetes bacterium T265]|nr:type I-E CRISPR-associated protein Cas5/CasD [Gemmatimonadetes bacterium T265]